MSPNDANSRGPKHQFITLYMESITPRRDSYDSLNSQCIFLKIPSGWPDTDPVDFSKLPCPISFHDLPSAFKNNFFEDPKALWGHSLFCSWENWLFQQLTSNNSVVNGLWQLSFLFEGTYIHIPVPLNMQGTGALTPLPVLLRAWVKTSASVPVSLKERMGSHPTFHPRGSSV